MTDRTEIVVAATIVLIGRGTICVAILYTVEPLKYSEKPQKSILSQPPDSVKQSLFIYANTCEIAAENLSIYLLPIFVSFLYLYIVYCPLLT